METRSAPRVSINLGVISRIDDKNGQKFSLSKGNIFEVKVVDISVSGVGIVSKYFLPKGLSIELEIDGKPFGLDEAMKIKGEIRYCNYIKACGYRCGVKFINILGNYAAKIAELIATYERRKEPRLKLPE